MEVIPNSTKKRSPRLRSQHYNNKMHCSTSSWRAKQCPISIISNNFFHNRLRTFNNRHLPQVPAHPEPPTPNKVQPEVTHPTSPPFSPDEMLQRLRATVKEDLESALKKFKDSRQLRASLPTLHNHHRHLQAPYNLQTFQVHPSPVAD